MCDAKPGDEVKLLGPTGKAFLLPESKNFHNDLIMVATGMGIAPYRSFIRRLFTERTPAAEAYGGQVFYGAACEFVVCFLLNFVVIASRIMDHTMRLACK